MLWRVLGPLEVRADNRWTGISAAKVRVLLAVLLVNPSRIVSTERLVDELWADDPPPRARNLVSQYVLRLRRQLGDPARQMLTAHPPGYRLVVGPEDLDAAVFEKLVAQGRSALEVREGTRAAELFSAALGLWRGQALTDVPAGKLVAAEAARLEELRLIAEELRIDASLSCGRAAELVPEMRRLTAEHPLRERFWSQLMRALGECGRPAEALAAYARAREIIAAELGADPGAELQELHHRILAGGLAQGGGNAVPHQLPKAVRDFTGRAGELRHLSGLLGESAGVISVISGTAGVGKTALAVHWAHSVADRFPDGQLYVNLRGFDPGPPMAATDALARFLRALGVTDRNVPLDEDERADRYRSALAGRRMLVVLDNAVSAEQVRPLLPGTAACPVLVTSRDALAGLVARDGARRLDLGLLPLDDAVCLLRTLIGERARASPDASAALAGQCSRLPLALRVAAELAASRPGASLASLTGELADQRHRLDLLAAGDDPRTAVRPVFSWSCRHLDPGAARTFRLLGLHPGPDFDSYAAAALTGLTVDRAGHLLDVLARAHLIEPAGQYRYTFHDLLRAYARELAAAHDGTFHQREALGRLFDHYLHTAAAVIDVVFPADMARRPRLPPPAIPCPAAASIAAAQTWLDAERANLAAVAAHAANGWPDHATGLAATLFRYLETGGYHTEIAVINEHACRAARGAGDRAAEADALHGLVVIDLRRGSYQRAAGRLRQVLAVHRETANRAGQARALGNLGIADFLLGRYRQATRHLHQALAAYRQTGDQAGQARNLSNLGLVALRLGNYDQACQHLDEALAICRDTGNCSDEAYALSNLGVAMSRLGDHQQASEHLRQALALCRDSGNRDCEAYALSNLGVAMSWLGDHQQASEHLRQALALCRQTGDRSSEAESLNSLGEILVVAGRPGDARAQQAMALGLASRIGDKYEQARAHSGLARSYHASGNLGQARMHWQQAHALYARLGTPEARYVRAQLAAVTGDDRNPES